MCTTIIGIIIVILSAIIALLALSIGGFTKLLKVFYYLHFPPARFYFKVMSAIERLETLSDKPSTPTSEKLKQGIVGSSDEGFKELINILQEKGLISGAVEEIILGEVLIGGGMKMGNIPLTPEKMRFLGVIHKEEQIYLQQEQFDLSRITRNLKDWAEDITRKRVAKWLVGLIFLYMITSIYLVLTT